MKTATLPRLLVVLYALLSFSMFEVLAAPTTNYDLVARGDSGVPSTTPAPATCSAAPAPTTAPAATTEIRPLAKQFLKWLGENGAHHQKICFYSGSTGGTGVWRNMGAISNQLGCDWISGLLALAGIPETETAEWTDAAEWTATSRALASIARNEAIVVLGETYREDSVWKTVELPVLRTSRWMGWISKIEQYNMIDTTGTIAGPFEVN